MKPVTNVLLMAALAITGAARGHFDEVIFGISILMMLFLIASVIAIAPYTVT